MASTQRSKCRDRCLVPGYGNLTEPLPIHAPAETRIRNATSVAWQPAVDELNEPENSALPCALSGTSGVSMTVGLAEPGPQTSVPLTWVTGPGVPIRRAPAGRCRSTARRLGRSDFGIILMRTGARVCYAPDIARRQQELIRCGRR
jgi:hypothetical protein